MGSDSPNDGQSDPSPPADVTELRSFSDADSANLAKASLEARGIECWLTADDCGGMLSGMDAVRGIKLLVRRPDSEAARALLAPDSGSVNPALLSQLASASPVPAASPPVKLSFPQIISGVIAGVLLCLLYQWTANLGTKTYRYDKNGDGKPDEVWIYRDGRLIEFSSDRNYDGTLDWWDHYDSDGYRTQTRADDNFDGAPDGTWNYTNGVLVSSRLDTDFNGKPDVTYTFSNEVPKQADWRPNETNVTTLRQLFRHGVLTEESRDTNMDGVFDVTILYDAFQNPIGTNPFKLLTPTSR